jgi:hypothetical protein
VSPTIRRAPEFHRGTFAARPTGEGDHDQPGAVIGASVLVAMAMLETDPS